MGEALSPQARRSVDTMAEAAQELGALLDTISQLVDLDSHTRLSKRYGDLAGLVRDIAAEFASSFDSSRTLKTRTPHRLFAIVDPVETRRAIWELLKNAVAYGPADSPVELRAAGDGATVWISVMDTGCGISPDERNRLVHAFERGNHAVQPVNSKGLGLAIARIVATAHGGRLELSDHTPHGLCATLVMSRFDGSQGSN
jgi:signal transduction histidine kinase